MPQQTEPKHSLHAKATLRFYWQATVRHRREALLALTLPLGGVLLGVFVPFFASRVLADVVHQGTPIWRDFAYFAAIALASFIANAIGARRGVTLQATVMRELQDTMFSRLLQRSVGFYNNQIGGKLVSDAIDFVSSYAQLFANGFVTAFSFTLTVVIGLVMVFLSSWPIGLSIMVLMAILVIWTIVENRRRSGLRNQRLKLSKKVVAHMSDNIVNAITVKTFAREPDETAANAHFTSKLKEARLTDWKRSVTNENSRMGVLLLMQIALMLVLIWLTRRDPRTLAAGIFAFTYTLTLLNRFFSVNTLARQIEDVFLQASPMTELLTQPIEITDAADAVELSVTQGEIVCHNVSFRYADSASTEYTFRRLNLHIRPGEKIGLVGHSGGGKSTLTRLLLRFDDISGGTIAIDGQDIRTVTQSSLRRQISYVPQEPLLFHRSIRENIAYGNTHASQADVERAATLAYAHDFIVKLPDGYDTIVGERGVKLSGGQRQRVAIARAILKNAPILVLDEATSALDSESEKLIQKALWELMDDKTAVVIAHRLSTIQKMDRILVLDHGEIVEEGTHKQLLEHGGIYAKLWAHQSGGFIEE